MVLPAEAASVAAAQEADIFVLLAGSRYGTLASTGRSIIHEEYLAAVQKKSRRYIPSTQSMICGSRS